MSSRPLLAALSLFAASAAAPAAACPTAPANVAIRCLVNHLDQAQDRIADLEAYVGDLEEVLTVDLADDAVTFTGVNLFLQNGAGRTDSNNGLGNLIVGYDEDDGDDEKFGSHNLVVGADHTYSSYGGLVIGLDNAITGEYAAVSGGFHNIASGAHSAVSGGALGEASGQHAAVSGGQANLASGQGASIVGGNASVASGGLASILGGNTNTASGDRSTIGGGHDNITSGISSTACGGREQTTSAKYEVRCP